MPKTRIKLTKPVIETRAQAEAILGTITADTAAANKLKAELDAELTAVRARFEGRIDALTTTIEHKTGLLQQWAEASPEEFGGRKSIEFLHGRLGFRTGNPSLKTLAGWTWAKVLEVLDPEHVRTKREADKEGILAAYARGDLADADLRSAGMRVIQAEAFFVEPAVQEAAGAVSNAA